MKASKPDWLNVRRLRLSSGLGLLLVIVIVPCAAYGQAPQGKSDETARSIAKVKSGSFINTDVETIVRTGGAKEVLPSLERQFTLATDAARQGVIASALVRLGDKDNAYWNFLRDQATVAIESDLPDPFHDSEGDAMDTHLSPELGAWAQTHGVDMNTAAQSALYDLPGKVFLIGETGDPRGIPLLRRALQSRNPMIVIMGAKGLAQIQDQESIPLIIEACRKAGKGFASGIAEASLIFFDDSQAQSAVDTYMPPDRAKVFRDAKAHGLKPFGY